jgi:hypothetical protein
LSSSAVAAWVSTNRQNPDVGATLKAVIDKVRALPVAPDLILFTGDISHLSKPGQFDTVGGFLSGVNSPG